MPLIAPLLRARRWVALAAPLWLASGCASLSSRDGAVHPAPCGVRSDWGPLYSRMTDLEGRDRQRILGPLLERSLGPTNQTLHAVRPLYAREREATGWTHHDLLYPLGTGSTLGNDTEWRVLVGWYQDYDTSNPASAWRLMVLPIYFQGRTREGDHYFAIFPIGGTIGDFLFRDRIDFALFPLWMRSEVRGIETVNWLFPVFARTDDPRLRQLRIFPFYGRTQRRDYYRKRFVLWPIWTDAVWTYRNSHGRGFVFFPFYGRLQLSDQSSWMVFPPFFRHSWSAQLSSGFYPWPFVQVESGTREKFYLWPLFGYRAQAGYRYRFLLWPLIHQTRTDRGDRDLHTFKALPFVYHETERIRYPDPSRKAPPPAGRFELWPLGAWDRPSAGPERVRVPDLWPGRNMPAIDRSWAPWWTLYRLDRRGPDADSEALWGFYRHIRRGDQASHLSLFPLFERTRDERAGTSHASWSILKGLLAREEDDGRARVRLLYVFTF